MKRLTILLSFLVSFFAVHAKNTHEQDVESLRQTELAFSKMCGEKGMKESFIFYADKDVIKPREGKFPIIGRDSLLASFERRPKETFKLEWYPVRVEVSASADLGYTFGNWILTDADGKKSFGNYVTFWKKQPDGMWKFVLDTGNSTPEPGSH
jgi:ketosteroid isomerase-like protein